MSSDREKESFEDAIRADIRQEILSSTRRRNRYSEQIAQIHREEEERKYSSRGKRRETEKTDREAVVKKRKPVKPKKRHNREADAQTILEDLDRKSFWKQYIVLCVILIALSGVFLSYVWRTIKLYETSRPELLVEQEIQSIQAGGSVDNIIFPELEESRFSNIESIKDSYIEMLQKGQLSYRFTKENYQTGDREYTLYQEDEPVAKLTLQAMKTEKLLGILTITRMQVQCIEPVLNILVWDYEIETLDTRHVYINDVEVPDSYITEPATQIQELSYLYEYVDLPKHVTYHVDGIYKEAAIRITDEQGNDVDYEIDGNRVIADKLSENDTQASSIAQEIDVLKAAETWSLFTTRDLSGANYGLEQVRTYFIRDSYYWEKLGEYARGIDITLVSDHNASATFFTEEKVSEYRMLGEDCFSCRISFAKHMKLNVGTEQVDKTDSIFYFVRIDDTDDNVDNSVWKIADIQAVVH